MRLSSFALIAVGCVFGMGCQALENDLDGSGSTGSAGVDAGPLGPVCCSGTTSCADDLTCCQAEGATCDYDYECCGGLCSSGACASSGNTACSASLGSRCTSKSSCACTTDDDCCQENTGAVCTKSAVTTEGNRCCLSTGTPCGGNGDCCSGSCDSSALTCD